jgi:hypothetical protein
MQIQLVFLKSVTYVGADKIQIKLDLRFVGL